MLLQILVASLILLGSGQGRLSSIRLKDNRYEGIVIAINPEIPEDPNLIQGIKVKSSGKYLLDL